MTVDLAGYFNRFDQADWYEDILFRAGKGLQSAELNEGQHLISNRLRKIADTLFRDGSVVSGEPPSIDAATGAITCTAAVIYITGAMRSVPERSFVIPVDGIVQVGVFLLSEVITEEEDPTLRDPATGTRNYNEPGAARLKQTPTWGYEGEGLPGEFFSVYTVIAGVIAGTPLQDNSLFFDALARYDRESNGSYIVRGLEVMALGPNTFSINEGVGNVFGYKLDMLNAQRAIFPLDPDLEEVTSEPDLYVDGSTDIQLNRSPLHQIGEVVATVETTETITRGGSSGGQDIMPDVSIVSVTSVVQGETTYVATTDYVLNGDAIEWWPAGDEPAPGSTYTVTYRYLTNVTPTDIDYDNATFKVAGAVPGELILTDYSWKLPRYDRICLTRQGEYKRIRGVSARTTPVPPPVPADLLSLATVEQLWRGVPGVSNDGTRAIMFNEIEKMRSLVTDLFDLVAIERLERDVASSEPTTKHGVFVDPFLDDDMRDQGIAQSAAVIGGALMMPIIPTPVLPAQNNDAFHTLPYVEESVLEQPQMTGSLRVNPYQNFEPLIARITLDPPVDRWTVTTAITVYQRSWYYWWAPWYYWGYWTRRWWWWGHWRWGTFRTVTTTTTSN